VSGFWAGADDWAARAGEAALDLDATGPEAAAPLFTELWSPPGPVAEAFYWSDDTLAACRGPVGSGKTRTHMASRLRRAQNAPASVVDGRRRYKVTFARATYRQLWQTTIPSWFEVMPRRWGKWAGGRGDPVTHAVELEDEFGVIEFTAEFLAFGEAPSEITANMRGVQTTDLSLEEADTIDATVIAVGIGRIDRYPAKEHFRGLPPEIASYGQLSATYNACEEENPIVGLFEPELAPDARLTVMRQRLEAEQAEAFARGELAKPFRIAMFRQPGGRDAGAENLQNLAKGYYAAQVATMTAMGRSDEITRLVDNRLGFVRAGDPVFANEFNPRIHVADAPFEPEPGERLILGFDQGFFGAGLVLTFRRPFQWRVHAEFCAPDRLFAEEFAARFRAEILEELFPRHTAAEAWGDMAGDKETAEATENLTWNHIVGTALDVGIAGQTEGNNRIAPRLRAIRAALDWLHLGTPGLLIHPRCRGLIRGFAARYVWGEELDQAGNKTTKPKKRGVREADLMDALAHALLSRATPQGLTPVSTAAGKAAARAESLRGHNGGPPLETPPAGRWDPFALWN
jgi:hypothetical protein